MLFVVLKTRLKFPVSGIKCEFFTGDERHANGRASDAVYLSAGMRSELHAISHIGHLKGVAPPVNAVSPSLPR